MENRGRSFEFRVLKRLVFLMPVGLIFILLIRGFSVSSVSCYLIGFLIVFLDYYLLARFTITLRRISREKKSFPLVSYFSRYLFIVPAFYVGLRVAYNDIFAIISGAVWATFAFTITITTLLKERSGWSTEDQNSSHGL